MLQIYFKKWKYYEQLHASHDYFDEMDKLFERDTLNQKSLKKKQVT